MNVDSYIQYNKINKTDNESENLLAMWRGELSAKIALLMSVCLWSMQKW